MSKYLVCATAVLLTTTSGAAVWAGIKDPLPPPMEIVEVDVQAGFQEGTLYSPAHSTHCEGHLAKRPITTTFYNVQNPGGKIVPGLGTEEVVTVVGDAEITNVYPVYYEFLPCPFGSGFIPD